MNVSVYYRGAMNKLHQIDVPGVKNHVEALSWVYDELKTDLFARKPFLALINGGGSSC